MERGGDWDCCFCLSEAEGMRHLIADFELARSRLGRSLAFTERPVRPISSKPVSDELPDGGQSTASHCHIDIRIFEQNFDLAMIKNEG